MALIRGGITVRPQTQAFADAVSAATGADNFGTYVGHDPSAELAVDIFVPVDSSVLGGSICDFLYDNWSKYAVDYWIYRQGIWNPPDRLYRRQMEDRGSPTQNHFDHVHVSFEDVDWNPGPTPAPVTERDAMSMYVRFKFRDQTPGRVGKLDYIFDGPGRILAPVGSNGILTAADKTGCVELGDIEQGDWDWFKGVADGWRRDG